VTIEIEEYLDSNGESPFAKWFEALDAKAAAKIVSAIDKMSRGLLGDVESVGGGVSERRIDFGPGYRVYFGSETDGRTTKVVILLCGGSKKRQNADIAEAKKLWKDYKSRKGRGEV
jgi:putative addiction module killer protein